MKAIRVAWISDIVGSIGRTREEEVADDLPLLAETLELELDLIVSSRYMEAIKNHKIDLLVFDYGGAANSYGNFVWDQFEALIKWAQEHEGSLALLYSSITGRMYQNLLKSEVDGNFRSENIMMWYSPGFGDWDKDIELQKKAKAWFIGGDFQPYEYSEPEPVVLEPPPVPAPAPKKPERPPISNKEIWGQAERINFKIEARVPWVEYPDGTKQGFSVFKTFCTDVYDDDNETQIGTIGGGTGYVTIKYKGKEWMIKHSDLWYAFIEAVEEKCE